MVKKTAKTTPKKILAILILQDGTHFTGCSFGAPVNGSGEVVFNTSLMGYQEILTDPSYRGQMVTMTYPMIGNYGVNSDDVEAMQPYVAGLIVKEYSALYSNFRAQTSLADYLKKYGIPGLEGIDTRALVRHLRTCGAMPGLISVDDLDLKRLRKKVKTLPSMEGQDLVKGLSCAKSYRWQGSTYAYSAQGYQPQAQVKSRYRVIAYDFGIKQNILRNLVEQGCEVTVVPATTSAAEVLAKNPDGVFLSNGPGDPAAVHYAIENVRQLAGKVPMFGICLGHQIMGLALGAKTFKLKFGHRGGNQPVKDLSTGKVEITAQNHGFAIEAGSLPKIGSLTHVNLNDNTVAGFANEKLKLFAVQYHPEASPGPHDSHYLFARFRDLMEHEKKHA